MVRFLLESGADPNSRYKTGETILCLAIQWWRNDDRLPMLLLEKGADPNLVGKPYGWENPAGSPLHAAILGDRRAVVEALVDKGADVNREYGRMTPLQAAADRTQNYDLANYLRSHGAR
jgi:ankyrin repeat protein